MLPALASAPAAVIVVGPVTVPVPATVTPAAPVPVSVTPVAPVTEPATVRPVADVAANVPACCVPLIVSAAGLVSVVAPLTVVLPPSVTLAPGAVPVSVSALAVNCA